MNYKKRSFESKNSNSLNKMIKKISMTTKKPNTNAKKLLMTIIASAVLLGGIFTLVAEDAFAKGKPMDVIAKSNGFPSGPHFNLVIHGKESFASENCVGEGGNSVFTPLNSTEGAQSEDQTLQMYVNKKNTGTTLEVKDKCTEAFDQTPAQVKLPTYLETDEGSELIEDGFWVFARVLGTPNNNKDEPSNIALWPDPQIEACNLNGTSGENMTSDCFDSSGTKQDYVELGYVTNNGAMYKCADEKDPNLKIDCEDQGLVRYDTTTSGKGANKAVDITPLFHWTGVGCEDTDGDGLIRAGDFNVTGGLNSTMLDAGDDLNGSLITPEHITAVHDVVDDSLEGPDTSLIDSDAEFEALMIILGEDPNFAACVYEENKWVFDVFGADLVIQNQTLTNDGVKNLQIRFYPKQTTEFTPSYSLD